MAKRSSKSEKSFAVTWTALTKSQKDRLLYLIVRWRVEKHEPFSVITQKVTHWVRDWAPHAFVANGKDLLPSQVGRYFGNAIDRSEHEKGSEPFVALTTNSFCFSFFTNSSTALFTPKSPSTSFPFT